MWSDIAAVDDDAVAHEAVRFVRIEKVNSGPVLVNGSERIGGESSGEDQSGFVVQWA